MAGLSMMTQYVCDAIHFKQGTASRPVLMENAAMLTAFCSGYACKSVRLPLDLPPVIRPKDAKER